MLHVELTDYRDRDEPALLAGLRDHDALALAEALHRSLPAAFACSRRLLGAPAAIEALIQSVFADLWEEAPEGVVLGSWVRSRAFELGAGHLRQRAQPPASPSLGALLPQLPVGDGPVYLDVAERALADLPEDERRALLWAHDRGVASSEQDDAAASDALLRGLVRLGDGDIGTVEACPVAGLGDWVLDLQPAADLARTAAVLRGQPDCEALVTVAQRGRRRIEGLPPTPDLGQRVLARVLRDGLATPTAATVSPAGVQQVDQEVTGPVSDGPGLGAASPPASPRVSDQRVDEEEVTTADESSAVTVSAPGTSSGDRSDMVNAEHDEVVDLTLGHDDDTGELPEVDDVTQTGPAAGPPPSMSEGLSGGAVAASALAVETDTVTTSPTADLDAPARRRRAERGRSLARARSVLLVVLTFVAGLAIGWVLVQIAALFLNP